jgi:hypothetical protein
MLILTMLPGADTRAGFHSPIFNQYEIMTTIFRPAIVLSALLIATGAQAATQIDAQLFSASLQNTFYRSQIDVLADNGTTVRLALSGFGADEGFGGRIDLHSFAGMTHDPEYLHYNDYYNGDYNQGEVAFRIKDGYRITSYTLTGKAIGSLTAAVVEPMSGANTASGNGSAHMTSDWDLRSSSGITGSVRQSDIVGTQPFAIGRGDNLTGESTLTISNNIGISLQSGYRSYHGDWGYVTEHFASGATLDFSDLELTVQLAPIAAVPEPTTWAMLLGGLALVGLAARKRTTPST